MSPDLVSIVEILWERLLFFTGIGDTRSRKSASDSKSFLLKLSASRVFFYRDNMELRLSYLIAFKLEYGHYAVGKLPPHLSA